MNLDFSKLKKVQEDKKSATFKHPDGHKVQVAKHVLSPKMRTELSSLPLHLDEGGEVPEQPKDVVAGQAAPGPQSQPTIIINNGQAGQQPVAPDQAPPSMPYKNGNIDWNSYIMQAKDAPLGSKIEAMKAQDQEANNAEIMKQKMIADEQAKAQEAMQYNQMAAQRGLPQVPVPNAPALQPAQPAAPAPQVPIQTAQQVQSAQAPQGMQDPYGTQAYMDAYGQGIKEQKAGIMGQAQAEGQMGQAQAALLHQQAKQQQEVLNNYNQKVSELEAERKAFQNDLMNKHIDPQRFVNNMSTGKKIMTGIGLIMGGFSSGYNGGGPNQAAEILKSQINNDIDAQKAEISKGGTLLSSNLQQFGNMRDAVNMTHVMMNDLVSNQLKEEAAKATDPMAKARALQAAGKLDMDAAPIISQMAMRRSLMSGLQNGNLDPSRTIRMIVPEPQQAKAYEELKDAQNMTRARDNVIGAFQQLKKINTVGNRVMSPIQSSKQIDAILNPVLSEMSKELAGKFTEFEFDALKNLFPKAGDSEETSQMKQNKIVKIMDQKMNFPMLQSYGINVGNSAGQSKYGAGGESKIQLGAPVVPASR